MQGARDVADFFNGRPQQIARRGEVSRSGVIAYFVRRSRDLQVCGSDGLRDRIMKLPGNASAFSLTGIDDFRSQLSQSVAPRFQRVEHLVDRCRQVSQSAVGHEGCWNSRPQSTL